MRCLIARNSTLSGPSSCCLLPPSPPSLSLLGGTTHDLWHKEHSWLQLHALMGFKWLQEPQACAGFCFCIYSWNCGTSFHTFGFNELKKCYLEYKCFQVAISLHLDSVSQWTGIAVVNGSTALLCVFPSVGIPLHSAGMDFVTVESMLLAFWFEIKDERDLYNIHSQHEKVI